jgi:hypothetical protein
MFGVGHWDCRYKPRRNEDDEEKKTALIIVSVIGQKNKTRYFPAFFCLASLSGRKDDQR